ncbi:MAG: OmpP1/FadL family transporter [Gammaproteobacteria bacterium]|nr:OmpP1/FadL family transporter [Gammaproteobacteria bacterium]
MNKKQLILAAVLGSLCSTALAGGFSIRGKSASSLGNGTAGTAVLAEDASVVYNNPAAMQDLDGTHFSMLLHTIVSDVQFEDKGSNISGPTTSSVDDPHFVPNLYYVKTLQEDMRFGLGIYAPFGLGLDYDDEWMGRYITTSSDLKVINISPALSFRASNKMNLGVGIDLQYLDATLANAVDFGTICAAYSIASCADPQNNDGSQELTGSNWALGFSFGLTYDIDALTRFGLSYHSATRHDVEGDSDFEGTPVELQAMDMFTDTGGSLTLNLPETLSLGLSRQISPQLQLLADATWTRWSRYDALVVEFDNNTPTSTTEQNWQDVWRFSVGGNYRLNETWLLRAGFSHDQTPIPNAQYRSPRVPDTDRNWFSLGSRTRLNPEMELDLAIAYTPPKSYRIDRTDSLGHILNGEYESEILYLTAQFNWQF